MKIKTQVTTTKEIEISLPYYCKNICFWYKVVSEKKCIQVRFSDYDEAGDICFCSASIAFNEKTNVQCTGEEFNEKFDLVIQQLKNVKEKITILNLQC